MNAGGVAGALKSGCATLLALSVAINIWPHVKAWPDLLQWALCLGVPAAGGWLGYWLGRDPPAPRSTVHGSAAFGDVRAARADLGGPDGLIVGRAAGRKGGWLLRYGGPGHLLTFAPTRAGKGVGVVLPNLLTVNRPLICIDPKGENARIAARARARFGPVHVLDPFAVSGRPAAAFNPLGALDPQDLDLAEDAALIAEALVYDPPEQVAEAHWNEEAKALIAGVILHVVCEPPPEGATLAAVRERLTAAPERFAAMLGTMQASGAAGGLVARAANRHLGKADREASGVLSAAQRHTHFLDSRRITDSLARSDFRFESIRSQRASVFLVLPPERLTTHARWLRLLVVQALSALAREGRDAGPPVLVLLDEFAALGRLEPLAQAYGLMAGYGVQLWAILQDLHQLRSLYGQRAGTFLANAAVTQVFNVADFDTAQWVSRTVGVTTETVAVQGWSRQSGTSWSGQGPSTSGGDGVSVTTQHFRRELLTPDEVLRLSGDQMLLLRPGQYPLLAWKVRHYADGEFRGLFDS